MSRTYNTEAVQGERWYRRLRYEEDNGTAISIAGADIRGQIRTHSEGDLVATIIVTIDGDGSAGTFSIEVSSDDTLIMKARQYYYDVFMNDVPLVIGAFEITEGMTKPEDL